MVYSCLLGTKNPEERSWITTHVHMYEYLGGIPLILIPDNTKTAVIHNNDWYTPQLNQTHHEMAEHYNTAILPARIRAPKDKPNVKGSVGVISTWITAALRKVLSKYANPVVLIIDEWLLLKPTEQEQHDILELLLRRRKKSSTIFCSQYEPDGWYDQLGGDDSPLAEAIIDRIKHDAYKINIIPVNPTNYCSMREVYGLEPSLSE